MVLVSLSETWGDAAPEHLPSILQRFHDSVVKYPENVALVCTHQAADLYNISNSPHSIEVSKNNNSYLQWSFKDLRTGVDRLRAGLESLGVQSGIPIVTLLPNCAEFALTWWAAMELGAVVAPIDPRRLSNANEVSHMLKIIGKATDNAAPVFIAFRDQDLRSTAIASGPALARVAVTCSGDSPHLIPFRNLMEPRQQNGTHNLRFDAQDSYSKFKDASIIFTSGSTSLPKGVLRTHPLQAALTYEVFNKPGYETLPGDLWCAVAPNSHSVGTAALVAPMLRGAGVVYAGQSFSAEETIEALARERCTHVFLVPAMINLITETISETRQIKSHLKAVMIAAAPPTLNNIQACFDLLGARGVCIRYGSTEGVACISDIVNEAGKLLGQGGQLSVGRPIPGACVKICKPGEAGINRPALPSGTSGEIHYCGSLSFPSIYVGREDTEDVCYMDKDGRRWFVTGDEGLICPDGRLFIVGRINDIIIRGGENISPAAIEARLADNTALASTNTCIIGQPDSISGEVPIAIVDGDKNVEDVAAEIHRTISLTMGPMWIPREVVHLKELGLEDWPRTPIGKIGKPKLRELLQKQHHSRQIQATGHIDSNHNGAWDEDRLRSKVLSIWASAVGLDEKFLLLDSPIFEFADSLTIARVSGQMKREIPGMEKFSIRDIAPDDTISGQITSILGKLTAKNTPARSEQEDNSNLPLVNAANMVHTVLEPGLFVATKELVTKAINEHGFNWKDVEDVFPAPSFISELSRRGILDSAKFQNAYITKTETNIERVKYAFEAMLRNNRILPSFLVWRKDESPGLNPEIVLHVTLKPSNELYRHVIQDGGSIDTVDELQRLASAHPHPEWTLFPGILFRVLLYRIKRTGTVGFIMSVSHGVMDATYLARFQSDLDQCLSDSTPRSLRPHVSYKLWAESYYSFRESPQARASVRWHADYLHGLQYHFKNAQWPPAVKRGPFDPSGSGYGLGARHSFEAPNLIALRKKYPGISVPVIIKTALVLYNVYQTGHDHAVFSNVQAGRTAWPFLPASFSDNPALGLFDEATDVAGPLLQSVVNLIKVNPDESVLDLLRRLQAEQEQLTQHAHTPWEAIEKTLDYTRDPTNPSNNHQGIMSKIFATQILNWIPGMGAQVAGLRDPLANFKTIKSVTRWQVGVIIRAGMGGVKNNRIFLHLFGDGLDDAAMEDMAKNLEKLVLSLTHPSNWLGAVNGCTLSPIGNKEKVS